MGSRLARLVVLGVIALLLLVASPRLGDKQTQPPTRFYPGLRAGSLPDDPPANWRTTCKFGLGFHPHQLRRNGRGSSGRCGPACLACREVDDDKRDGAQNLPCLPSRHQTLLAARASVLDEVAQTPFLLSHCQLKLPCPVVHAHSTFAVPLLPPTTSGSCIRWLAAWSGAPLSACWVDHDRSHC